MQKHFYQQPLIEVITFPKTDIICTSINNDILEWDKEDKIISNDWFVSGN